MDQNTVFLTLIGICAFFLGLTCLGVWKIAARLPENTEPQVLSESRSSAPLPSQATVQESISTEMIAAISAAIAEDLGTDISAIRITSVKEL